MVIHCFFFFFKQKTAYEMRISDWSSDVCSSDLSRPTWRARRRGSPPTCIWRTAISARRARRSTGRCANCPTRRRCGSTSRGSARRAPTRSEEHTSELQSLMRISYAVFCLKKKTQHNQKRPQDHSTEQQRQRDTTQLYVKS